MTPAQRVYAVLRGEIPDQVPFTVYEYLMDGFPFEQSLREQGACVVHRVSSARITYPNSTNNPFTDAMNKVLNRTPNNTKNKS